MSNEDTAWNKYWNTKELWQNMLKYTPTARNVFRFCRSLNLPKRAKILDAGCGTGKLASFWAEEGYDIVGIDISEEALAITRKKGVKTKKADILKGLPFKDGEFDLVYSDGLLEHFTDPEEILTELFRVSKKHVLTFVPRISPYANVTAALLRPPEEFKREDNEWVNIHKKFKPAAITSKKIRYGVFSVLCKK